MPVMDDLSSTILKSVRKKNILSEANGKVSESCVEIVISQRKKSEKELHDQEYFSVLIFLNTLEHIRSDVKFKQFINPVFRFHLLYKSNVSKEAFTQKDI